MLEIRNLSKSLGGRPVLNNLSFEVETGQIFGYLGPNGAGKTTTIRVILGLLRPNEGSVLWHGQPVIAAVRARWGFLLDADGLYSNLTLEDNLKFYARIYRCDWQQAQPRLTDLLEQFELRHVLKDKVATFSKGMRQKAAFVRALFHRPEFLILDEPFEGLDPEMQAVMRNALLRVVEQEGLTVFLSSHNLYEIERLCAKIAIIRKGQIQVCDFVDRLKQQAEQQEISVEDIYFKTREVG